MDHVKKMEFDRKITLGNVIEIMLILVGIVWGYAVLSQDLSHQRQDVHDLRLQHQLHQQRTAETYVRKDVFDQVLIRLEDIKKTVENIERRQ